jgi:hypothetical protein
MDGFPNRVLNTIADATIGAVVVMVHRVLAHRIREQERSMTGGGDIATSFDVRPPKRSS